MDRKTVKIGVSLHTYTSTHIHLSHTHACMHIFYELQHKKELLLTLVVLLLNVVYFQGRLSRFVSSVKDYPTRPSASLDFGLN